MKYYQLKEYPVELILSEQEEKHFTLHNHSEHYVIGLVLEGTINFHEQGEKERICQKDDLFTIPYYVVHELHIKKETRLLSLSIGIEMFEKRSIEEVQVAINKCLYKLECQGVIQEAQSESILEATILLFTLHQIKKHKTTSDIDKVINQLKHSPEIEIQLEQLAEQIYISKYYLIRKFKSVVGLTPHQFQIQNKIRRSQELIEEGKELIEVSNELGFYDQSHFIKSFNKVVGVSPKEYKDSVEQID